ncbi:SRPBCC family protein [Amnibacterium sp. CER49]|uniref:SRPBCC family protein n=1 Tax=Amnibacterium sp. CER49 TaxID=3039161 RepID=UPI002449E8C5|nr:SRPBCC family protein [Amnibacterium sp. CER49]MDH2445153.1 SRPBCC family protein [Amnibacterium sp. CER49]
MTTVEHRILVNVPVSVAYNQWTQFEDFPHFMNGIKKVTQLSDDRLQWVAQIGGVRREWEAKVLEQIPDRKVAWAATEGATNAGEVTFEDLGGGQTTVRLRLEYEPEGPVEKVGDKLNVVDNQTENDLARFKELVESEGYASGAWRGTIQDVPGTPTVEDAAATRGDSGKAGVSGKVVAGAAAAAAAAVVGGIAAAKKGSSDTGTADRLRTADHVAPANEQVEVVAPIGTDQQVGTHATAPRPITEETIEDGVGLEDTYGTGTTRPGTGV